VGEGQKFGTGRHRRAFACDDGLGMRSERSAVHGATPSGRAGEQFQCVAKTGHDPGELEGAELFCGRVRLGVALELLVGDTGHVRRISRTKTRSAVLHRRARCRA
jgi:hypothetical protein